MSDIQLANNAKISLAISSLAQGDGKLALRHALALLKGELMDK